MLWITAMQLLLSTISRYGLSCRNYRVHEQCWVCIACQSVTYVVKFYYCWTWQIWIVFYVEDCGESNAECCVHLVGVDRVMYFQRVLWCAQLAKWHKMQGWWKVLWCHPHLVWLVFEGSIPTCACFHSENLFVTCSCCFFFVSFVFQGKMHDL